MAFPGVPEFQTGLMMQDGTQMQAFVHNTLSVDINLRAHAGGGQQFATLVDAVFCVISRVTTTGDSIQLPPTNGRRGFGPFLGGLQLILVNSTSNACQVFGNFFETSTIGGVSGSVGLSLGAGGTLQLVCGAPGIWVTIIGAAGGGLPATGGTLSGFLGYTTQSGLVGIGTTQAGALLLNHQTSIASSCPAGAGFRLPSLADIGILGPIEFVSKDSTNQCQVYPPVGGQIDSFGTNASVLVPTLTQLVFSPDPVTPGQWWS